MPDAGRSHGPPATKKQAAVATGQAGTTGGLKRNGFNGCFALSLVCRLVCHHRFTDHHRKA
jgi:hypothetical protein